MVIMKHTNDNSIKTRDNWHTILSYKGLFSFKTTYLKHSVAKADKIHGLGFGCCLHIYDPILALVRERYGWFGH